MVPALQARVAVLLSAAVLCTAGVVGASAAVCGLPGSQSRQKCEPCLTSSMCTTGWCCPYHKLCLPNPAGTNTAGEAAGEAGGEAGANTCNLAKTSAQCVANCPDYVCGPLGCPLCTGCKKTGFGKQYSFLAWANLKVSANGAALQSTCSSPAVNYASIPLDSSCFLSQRMYQRNGNVNMPGTQRVKLGSIKACQLLCKNTISCLYFSYRNNDGWCHRQSAGAKLAYSASSTGGLETCPTSSATTATTNTPSTQLSAGDCENAEPALCQQLTHVNCAHSDLGPFVQQQCAKLCLTCDTTLVTPSATSPPATPSLAPTAASVLLTKAAPTAAPQPATTAAKKGGFDFGGKCEGGAGFFTQDIKRGVKVTVDGVIPAGKMSVSVRLESVVDVDVQLVDVAKGTEIVAWPNGLLNGGTKESTTFQSLTYTYSGYQGDGTGLGNEYITVDGTTNRELRMRAFGYKAGNAKIMYSWKAPNGCIDQGQGQFTSAILYRATSVVGTIPAGKTQVVIRLSSAKDVDVQLFDTETGAAIIAWGVAGTKITSAGVKCATYEGNTYCYSGFNGDYSNTVPGSSKGNEWISIKGVTKRAVTMKAYGFNAGKALVEYSWGQKGYCAGEGTCTGRSKALKYNEVIDSSKCASPCTWFDAKPYTG